MSATVDRIAPLQGLRAIASIAIAFAHFHNQFLQVGNDNTMGFLAIGVDVFFVTSGFIMLHIAWGDFGSAAASWEFLRRRLARIVPLYWACTTVFLIYILDTQTLEQVGTNWQHYFASLAFIPIRATPFLGVGWTLNFEMFFYVCFAACLLLPRAAGLACLAIGFVAFVIIQNRFAFGPPVQYWASAMIFEFLAGVGLAVLYRYVRPPAWLLVTLLIVTSGIAYLSYSDPMFGIPKFNGALRPLIWGAASVSAVACAIFIRLPMPRWLSLMGDASYAIYLIHPLMLYAALEFIGRMYAFHGINVPNRNWPFALGLLGLTIGLSIVIHLAAERPLMRWLNSLGREPRLIPKPAS